MAPPDLKTFIRDVPDFPKSGIMFKDITPLLRSPEAFAASVARLAEPFLGAGVTQVAAIESRGFFCGGWVAGPLRAGFVRTRRRGNLRGTRRSHEYELEYGSDKLEIHDDALAKGDRVLIVDDV